MVSEKTVRPLGHAATDWIGRKQSSRFRAFCDSDKTEAKERRVQGHHSIMMES